MDYIEKLSCKEIMELSDVENSASEEHKETEEMPKKRKRRRREIDMIKVSDDEDSDDDGFHKKVRSPGPNSPGAHREPRTCVLKASQKRRPLSRLLEQLLRNLEKKDPNQYFAWPVNDNFAPNYSNIIRKPMDFCTMKQKIDDNEYKSLHSFINDFKLMCNNAMRYNKSGTVYHKAARKLLHAGLRQLAPSKLRPLGSILTYMYEIPIRELGFDIGKMDLHKVQKRGSPIKSGEENDVHSEDSGYRQDNGDAVKLQMEAERERHRRKLAKKAFPRMDSDGKTTLCIATGEPVDERHTMRHVVGRLSHGTGSLHTPREDRRNLVKGVKPLNYGPFSSYAPSYDGTFATLTKEQSHLLYYTLPWENGEISDESLRFAPDSPWSLIYDMESLFPVRKQAPEADPVAEKPDISSTKVDIEELKSLSSLGIDTEFLNNMEEDIAASQQDFGISPALKQTLQLLTKLEQEQRDRLSQPPPWHLSLLPRASPSERDTARNTAFSIRAMLAKVPPKHVASVTAVRRAMGVTLDHLDTPVSMDDFEVESSPRADPGSDRDSRSSHDLK